MTASALRSHRSPYAGISVLGQVRDRLAKGVEAIGNGAAEILKAVSVLIDRQRTGTEAPRAAALHGAKLWLDEATASVGRVEAQSTAVESDIFSCWRFTVHVD